MKKGFLITGLIGIILSSFLPLTANAAGTCTWRMKIKSIGTADNPIGATTGGCLLGEIKDSETSCDAATNPGPKTYINSTGTPECCCSGQNPTQDNCYWQKDVDRPAFGPVRNFICGAGYEIQYVGTDPLALENKCRAIAKPTDTSFDYACCCAVTQTPTISAAEAPQFTMPEFQVKLPTLKLTEPECTLNSDGSYHCEIPWLGQYIVAVYNYGLSVAGILAAIILMAGGVLWLISGGDSGKIGQAKELIMGSIVGLVILAGSYIILTQINPDLVKFKAISIGTIKGKQMALAGARYSSKAEDYKNAPCATETELERGIEFYATGYYKPIWEDTDNFRCVIAMQCSCPLGIDTTKNCDQLYGQTFPGYHPCKPFTQDTPYCNMTATGSAPQDGDIAGPNNCRAELPYGTQVCFRGQTYTIKDTGGGIMGKRIDVWSGDNLDKAMSVTGVGTLTKGPCK